MWAVSLFFAASLALSPALRFAFAGFGLYFILVGSSLESAPAKARSFWGWVTTAGAAAGFLLLLSILGGRFAPMDFWLLRQDAASYSRGRVHNDPSPLVSAARLTMSPRDVLLLVGDGRALSYPCRVIWNSVHDEPLLATCARTEKDGEGFSRRLRRLGVSYVGFNLSEGSETGPDYGHWDLSAAEREKMFLWCETHLEPIRAGAGWALLRVCEVGVAQGMPVTFWEEAFPLPQKGSEK
jgi:hypothetical protein